MASDNIGKRWTIDELRRNGDDDVPSGQVSENPTLKTQSLPTNAINKAIKENFGEYNPNFDYSAKFKMLRTATGENIDAKKLAAIVLIRTRNFDKKVACEGLEIPVFEES